LQQTNRGYTDTAGRQSHLKLIEISNELQKEEKGQKMQRDKQKVQYERRIKQAIRKTITLLY